MSKKEETSSPSLKRSWFQELKAEFGKITWPTKDSPVGAGVLDSPFPLSLHPYSIILYYIV